MDQLGGETNLPLNRIHPKYINSNIHNFIVVVMS